MYTRKVVPIRWMLRWTRTHIIVFVVLAFIPVFLFDVVGFKWLHIPWLPLSVLGTAVAFIVGFKNNASYDRLWEARKIWGGIVNASRSFTVMVKDFIQNDDVELNELATIHRELVLRHVAWMTALRYQLRTVRPWENKRATPANRRFRGVAIDVMESNVSMKDAMAEYLAAAEWEEISTKSNQASQLLGIQSRRLKELRQQGALGVFEHVELERAVAELYTLQGESERIKNFPYPRQFATLNYIFVWLFIFLLPYGLIEEFEKIGDHIVSDHQAHETALAGLHSLWTMIGKHFVWFSIPFSAIVSWVFYALEVVGEHSETRLKEAPTTFQLRICVVTSRLISDNLLTTTARLKR